VHSPLPRLPGRLQAKTRASPRRRQDCATEVRRLSRLENCGVGPPTHTLFLTPSVSCTSDRTRASALGFRADREPDVPTSEARCKGRAIASRRHADPLSDGSHTLDDVRPDARTAKGLQHFSLVHRSLCVFDNVRSLVHHRPQVNGKKPMKSIR
jgi:hypothetical protein